MQLDISQLLRILPYRAPMLLLDRVTDLVPRKSARAIKCISANEPLCVGHFPGAPLFPSVLALEALAQLMCVLAYASDALDANQHTFVLAGVDKAKFRLPMKPGDRLELEVELLQRRSNIWKCHGRVMADDAVCLEADLLAAITRRDDPSGI